jgi:hypothetical protein
MNDSSFEFLDADLRRLRALWNEKRGAHFAAARADMDPATLRFILGNVLLVDVLREPLRFRYRLVGTNLVGRLGFDLTGKLVDEHPEPEFRQTALKVYHQLIETRVPYQGRFDQAFDGRTRRFEVLLLPLSSDGAAIDMVLGAMKYLS